LVSCFVDSVVIFELLAVGTFPFPMGDNFFLFKVTLAVAILCALSVFSNILREISLQSRGAVSFSCLPYVLALLLPPETGYVGKHDPTLGQHWKTVVIRQLIIMPISDKATK
jgi:hypothetical protein